MQQSLASSLLSRIKVRSEIRQTDSSASKGYGGRRQHAMRTSCILESCRLALRIGLHRDPFHWPNILPLEAEFRRRLWITLYHMDFCTNTQVRLPRIINDSQCDAQPPANLSDDGLSFKRHEVPPERPLTDPTPLSHLIQRQTINKVAAEMCDAAEAGPQSSATDEVLSAKVDRAINSIPEQSKYRSLETSIADNPATILHRIFIDILINKAVYLLHRRGFMKGSVEEETTS